MLKIAPGMQVMEESNSTREKRGGKREREKERKRVNVDRKN